MTMKPGAVILGAAAVIAIGAAAYLLVLGGPNIEASELPDIVIASTSPPEGMNHDATNVGREALVRPIVSVEGAAANAYRDQPGFVDGRYTEFSNDQAGLLSWSALFESAEDAETALELYVTEVQSRDGYRPHLASRGRARGRGRVLLRRRPGIQRPGLSLARRQPAAGGRDLRRLRPGSAAAGCGGNGRPRALTLVTPDDPAATALRPTPWSRRCRTDRRSCRPSW